MRELIDLIEAFNQFGRTSRSIVGYCKNVFNEEFPLYKNARRNDLQSVIDNAVSDKSARGLLTQQGDLYFWDSYGAVHTKVESILRVQDSIYLRLDMEQIMIVPQRRREISHDAEETVSSNPNVQRLKIADIVLRPDLTA